MSTIGGTQQPVLLDDSMADDKRGRIKQNDSEGLPPLPPQSHQRTEKNAPIVNPTGCQSQGRVLFITE